MSEPGPIAALPLPAELYLEVTNRCNLKCTTCPQSWGMAEGAADLSAEQVKTILAQAPSVRRVVLHGIGEPTLNRELPEIVRAVASCNAYALFNTNGLLLRGRIAAGLASAGINEVRISIDAGEASTYTAIRGANLYHRVIANASLFARHASTAGHEAPRVSLWMTGLKSNLPELESLVRQAAAAGIREVYLQRLVFSERGNAREEHALFGRLSEREEEMLRHAEDLAQSLGIMLAGSGEALPPAGAPERKDAPWRACWRPYRLMYITANGNVLPCCIAPFTRTPYGNLVLGNVFEEPLAAVWNGERYRAWRARMATAEPPEPCASCGSDWAL